MRVSKVGFLTLISGTVLGLNSFAETPKLRVNEEFIYERAYTVGSVVILVRPTIKISGVTAPIAGSSSSGFDSEGKICRAFGIDRSDGDDSHYMFTGKVRTNSPIDAVVVGSKGVSDLQLSKESSYYEYVICQLENAKWKSHTDSASKVIHADGSVTIESPYVKIAQPAIYFQSNASDMNDWLCKVYGYSLALRYSVENRKADSQNGFFSAEFTPFRGGLYGALMRIDTHTQGQRYSVISSITCMP